MGSQVAQLAWTDAKNKLQDLSGIVVEPGQNPYQAFIDACNDNHAEIQSLYAAHRTKRNEQQRQKFLSSDFEELIIDPFLLRLERPDVEPGFKDHRYCMTFWARPPDHIIKLAAHLQDRLKKAAPNVWLMPQHRMHLTTLEVTHSKTQEEVASLVTMLRPSIPGITGFTHSHRSRLVKPMISYDLAAFAVSFLPASAEPLSHMSLSHCDGGENSGMEGDEAVIAGGDRYTYHHLRRDVFDLTKSAGIEVVSRYQVPSAHITLGRYLGQEDHQNPEQRKLWVEAIDDVNRWLEKEVWDAGADASEFCGEWVVGQERGLDARCGTLWYGGGRSINVGEGF